MPVFDYMAKNKSGQASNGVLEARDRSDALRKLSQQGVKPLRLIEQRGGAKSKNPAKSTTSGGEIRLSGKLLVFFTEELSDLLSSGLQLEPALRIMESRSEQSQLKALAGELREKLRDGMSFSQALKKTSPSFSELYCNLAAAGELSGALGEILERQAKYLATMQEVRGKVLTAMIYPSFLLVSGIGVTVLFVTFLIPKLTSLINTTGSNLPMGAQLLVNLSGFLGQYWWMILAAIGALIALFLGLLQVPSNRPVWDRLKLKIPLLGPLQLTRFHVQILETLSNVIGNGLPLLKALELGRETTSNLFLRQKMDTVIAEIGDGAHLSGSFQRTGVFPPLLTDLLRVGEETGQLEEAMAKAAKRFDRELTKSIERVSALVQPMIVLLMTALVGTMAYIMISMIYETITLLQSR